MTKSNPYTPNPQGKGLVPLLQALELPNHANTADLLPPKSIAQIQMELFTSMFILQSDFTFNPIVQRSYWLYQVDEQYRLLLVAPDEWLRPYHGRFIGECILQKDRTWTLALSEQMAENNDFMQRIEREREKLQQNLEAADSIEEVLPKYEKSFSFYGRVLAFSLGKSLDISMQMSGIKGLSYQDAKGLLTHEEYL